MSKFVGARSHVRNQKLMVVQLTLSAGECLPCLVDDATWLPVTLATRWAVTYHHQRVQSSTLRDQQAARQRKSAC